MASGRYDFEGYAGYTRDSAGYGRDQYLGFEAFQGEYARGDPVAGQSF